MVLDYSLKDIHLLQYMNRMYKRILDEIDVGVHAVDKSGKTIIYNKKIMETESMDFHDVMDKN